MRRKTFLYKKFGGKWDSKLFITDEDITVALENDWQEDMSEPELESVPDPKEDIQPAVSHCQRIRQGKRKGNNATDVRFKL